MLKLTFLRLFLAKKPPHLGTQHCKKISLIKASIEGNEMTILPAVTDQVISALDSVMTE